MEHILLVEDDISLRRELRRGLEETGWAVSEAATAQAARRLCLTESPDLVILDVGLPDGDGFSLCRALREKIPCPILILTGFGSDDDVVLGFQSGADDYVTKPCSLRVLQSRIRALLRRADRWDSTASLCSGDLHFDLIHKMIFRGSAELLVSRTEFDLCLALLRQNGRIYQIDRPIEQLARDGRPLSMGADLAAMAEKRMPLYRAWAACTIDNTSTPQVAAETIRRDFDAYLRNQWAESEPTGTA